MVRVEGFYVNMNLPGIEELPFVELKKNCYDKYPDGVYDSIPEEQGVYFLIDWSGDVVYIGETKNLRLRIKNKHNILTEHQNDVISISWLVLPMDNDIERFILEKAYILYYKPKWNQEIRHRGVFK